jgi:transposase
MGYIKGEERNQTFLFPESFDEYIHEENPVRIIDEYVEQLDMKELKFQKAVCSNNGRPPYNPKDLLKLYLYGYLNRIRSSRRLEHEASRNIEVIWLLKKLKPDFKTIADFRRDNKKALKAVFRQFVRLCDEWDLFGKELVAIDGTKIRACNSKRNNYSAKKLERHIQYIDEKIDTYLKDLEAGDQAESIDRKPSAEEIQKRIKELRNRKLKYEGYQEQLKNTGENEISINDPDARLMCNNNNNVDVSYNIQTTVDAKNKLIADFKVTTNPNDLGELDNMALRAKTVFGAATLEVLADKGYYKAEDLKKCVEKHITPYVTKQVYSNGTGDRDFYTDKFHYDAEKKAYICPAGKELYFARNRTSKDRGLFGYEYRNYEACGSCQYKERCTKSQKGRSICRHVDQDFLDTIDLQTEINKEKYQLRQMIIEHVFGTIKRGWEAYYFLTKRKLSVSGEIALSFLAYNFRRAINLLGPKEIFKRLREKRELAMG